MKTLCKIQPLLAVCAAFIAVLCLVTNELSARSTVAKPDVKPVVNQSIMLALLLDTSNSMDGLIDQAKSQLWKIVNELAAAKTVDGQKPQIRIALYEYGNDGLSSGEGYIRLVSPLTTDLDVISEKLFALSTNGGNEFCGHVIDRSLVQLDWSTSVADLKMIFIAGNEPFTQGNVSYEAACTLAKEKNVIVNTIFCGSYDEGVRTSWKRGADLTGGTYMSIEQNERTVYVPSPYDKEIDALNDKLNDTYIYYGKAGAGKKELQSAQDNNAAKYGAENKAERAISKSTHAYTNSSWDLVDASKDNQKVVSEIEDKYLPAEMRSMTIAQREAFVKQKAEERKKIQSEIRVLAEKRKQYIATQTTRSQLTMLDAVMIKAIKQKAKEKNLTF